MSKHKSVLIHEDIDHPELVRASYKGREIWMHQFSDGYRVPVLAGGAVEYPNPVAHPLAAPTITGTDITVDLMLDQPTRVTSYLMDITLQRFLLDRLFTSPGGVSGGAVVYDVMQENDLYSDRDVQPIAPGGEFPVVTSHRLAPRVAEVEKYGGKFFFTDEARDRNDQTAFRNEATRLGNTIVRKLNTRAVAVLEDAIANNGGFSNFVGNDWATAIPNGSNPTPPAETPAADFAMAQLMADQRELGIQYNVALVNPAQLNALRLFYTGTGNSNGLETMLSDNGYDEVFASNRVPAGTAYFVAEGQLGEMRLEKPLATETWREPENERTWVQSGVRPVMFVNNAFAVVKATGLGG
ncbi:MAG TPA: major capsid protein [Nocardioidaceae bacterium]|nr:major capsid protein [Nocardioidaceae bacterium]